MLLTPVVLEAQKVVGQFMQSHHLKNLPFHNFTHTSQVVKAAREIAAQEPIRPAELEALLVAAWFHDTGYSSRYKGHEAISRQLALTFLQEHHYPAGGIQLVLDCIQATKVPQCPQNLPAKILCDADLSHLATADYANAQERLRQEWLIYLDLQYSDQEWVQANLAFMNAHHYFTPYAQRAWQAGKNKNRLLLETNSRQEGRSRNKN
jgi:predicted metal-dependent HD superfamily phosphohydrolase